MGEEYRSTAFKSGNSVAVRFPKPLGLKPGVELLLREEDGRFIVERAAGSSRHIDLTGIYGSMPGLKPLTSEERTMEPRGLDWGADLSKRG